MLSVYPQRQGRASHGSLHSFFRNAIYQLTKTSLLLLLAAIVQHATAQSSGCTTPSFAPAVTYGTGGDYPRSIIAVGDVNGDGRADLAVTNIFSNTVGVLLNTGNGTFAPAVTYGTGGDDPTSVAIGDLNGDGKPDLAVVNNLSANVGVLLNNGNGTFAPVVTFSSGGREPYFVAIGDLNGDGKQDLALTNARPGTVGVLLNAGNGTFAPVVNYNTGGNYTISVAIGDLNGDGKADLAETNYDANVQVGVLLNAGNGTFAPVVNYISGDNPRSVAIGDVNADGKPDLVVANDAEATSLGQGSISILLNNGDGTFANRIVYPSSGNDPHFVAIGDLNGDGKADLAVTNYYSNTVGVLLGQGNGTFAPAVTFSSGGSNPFTLALGDLNGDGSRDLAVVNESSNNIGLLLNNCVAPADNDGDGVPDAYDCEPKNKKVAKYLVCHKGKTLCIGKDGVKDHLGHGDKLGSCNSTTSVAMNAAAQYNVPAETVTASSVYPNPTTGIFTLQLNNAAAGLVQVLVLDARGAVVERRSVQLHSGPQTLGFNLQGKAAGLYLLRVVNAAGEQQFRVYVQR